MSRPRTGARRLAPEARRRAILDAAIRLFGRSGYANVSTAEIADKAGVTPALVHHYFGPKRQIFLAIMAEWQQLAVQSLDVDRTLPFRTRLEASATAWFEQIARYPALWMATDSEGGASGDKDVAAIRDRVRLGAVELLLEKFDDVVDDTPAARWALLGFTGYHDVAMRAYMKGEIDAETTIALLTEGVSATLTTTIPALSRGDRRSGRNRDRSPGKRRRARPTGD
jgi:AcrR family transcriptional regulator